MLFRSDLEKGWELLFERKGCEPHRLFYEDLDRDPVGVARGVLDFVGVSDRDASPIDIPTPMRQRDGTTDQWIESYRANS